MKDNNLEKTLFNTGQHLIELRKNKGYSSHEDFALDHDLPRIQYWRMERGRTNFTMKSLHKILAIHNIKIEEFFCSKEVKQK